MLLSYRLYFIIHIACTPRGGCYSQTSRKRSLRPRIYPNGLEYPRQPGISPPRAGNNPTGRGYSPRVGNIPTQPGISPKRTGNIPAGREYPPKGREYSRRPGIFPAGREYSRRPGIFLWGPGTKGTLVRSRPPAVISPAGRECFMDFSGRYRGMAAVKYTSPTCQASPIPRSLLMIRRAHSHELIINTV